MADPKPPRSGTDVIVDRVVAAEKRTRTFATASGTQRARTMQDLLGRGAYAASSEDSGSWAAVDLTWTELEFGPPVTILIAEPRVVRCQYTVLSNIGMIAFNSTADVYGVMRIRLKIDGELNLAGPRYAQNNVGSSGGVGAAGHRSVSQYQTLSLVDVLTLPAGEHTIQGMLTEPAMFSNEGAGSWSGGAMQAFNPSLVVDVLQLA